VRTWRDRSSRNLWIDPPTARAKKQRPYVLQKRPERGCRFTC